MVDRKTRVVGTVALLLFVVALTVVKADDNESSPTAIGEKYLHAISNGDFKTAYQLTGKAFRYAISESTFSRLPLIYHNLDQNMIEPSDYEKFKRLSSLPMDMLGLSSIGAEAKVDGMRATLSYIQTVDFAGLIPVERREEAMRKLVRKAEKKLAEVKKDKTIGQKAVKILEQQLKLITRDRLQWSDIVDLQLRKDPESGKWEVLPFFDWETRTLTSQDMNATEKGGEFKFESGPRYKPGYRKNPDTIKYCNLWIFQTNPPYCPKCDYLLQNDWKFCPICGSEINQESQEKSLDPILTPCKKCE